MSASTLRVVAYAINGRGMGHLTRQLAILRAARRIAGTLGQRVEPWVLTSSEADTLARREGVPSIKIPSKSMLRDAGIEPARYLAVARGWVLQALATLQPDLLLVDTFAGGSFGELVAALELARNRVLVRRRMRPEADREARTEALIAAYDRVIVPDEAEAPILLRERAELLDRAAARRALGLSDGDRACWITLGGGGDPEAGRLLPRLVDVVAAAGFVPVVAAGPLYAGPERRGPGVVWIDRYAAMELLPAADVAVSAGGYNAVHELRFVGVPTVFLPLEKLADDQEARALASGLGPAVSGVEAVGPALARLAPVEPRGRNGATEAAVAALSLVLDPRDVARAAAAWDDRLLGALRGTDLTPTAALSLVRLFAAEPPSQVAHRAALAAEWTARGGEVRLPPVAPGADPARFVELCRAHGAEVREVLPLAEELARRFPAAGPAERLAALERWVARWAPADAWMGVLALVRALPTQREYRLDGFTDDLFAWLGDELDPYSALRRLHALEARGRRPLAEVLRMRGP